MTSDAVQPASLASTVLRPSRAAYARAFKANLWIGIPLLVIAFARAVLNPWLLPVLVIAVAVSFGGMLLYFRNARVEFGDGRYRVVNRFGAVREFAATDVRTLITVLSLNSGSMAPASPQLILTRPDGSTLLRLRGQTWDVEQFTVLAQDLIARGVDTDAILEPITTGQLRARYPQVIGWWEAHPIAFGLILGLGIVAVAILVVVVVFVASVAG